MNRFLSGLRVVTWLGTVRQWHWISSALCLVAMLLFAITGITLNHANQIEAQPKVITIEHQLPDELLPLLHDASASSTTLPLPLRDWLELDLHVSSLYRTAERAYNDLSLRC